MAKDLSAATLMLNVPLSEDTIPEFFPRIVIVTFPSAFSLLSTMRPVMVADLFCAVTVRLKRINKKAVSSLIG